MESAAVLAVLGLTLPRQPRSCHPQGFGWRRLNGHRWPFASLQKLRRSKVLPSNSTVRIACHKNQAVRFSRASKRCSRVWFSERGTIEQSPQLRRKVNVIADQSRRTTKEHEAGKDREISQWQHRFIPLFPGLSSELWHCCKLPRQIARGVHKV
jgi:hypothetical protein